MKSSQATSGTAAGFEAARTLYRIAALALLLAYLLSGVTVVAPGEVALIRRWGRWRTESGAIAVYRPGFLFAWPIPFEDVLRLNVKQERQVGIPSGAADSTDGRAGGVEPGCCLLTGDQNALTVEARVKFRIVAPGRFLTATQEPAATIGHAATSSLVTTLNLWTVEEVLQRRRLAAGGRPESLAAEVLSAAQRRLDQLDIGVELTAVEIIMVQPPAGVQDAFLAVQSARVDQDAVREEAAGEREEALLSAETLARQFVADARGRLSSRLAQATGEAALFEAALAASGEPEREVTARRLQQETWEQILSSAGRVHVIPRTGRAGAIRLSIPEPESRH